MAGATSPQLQTEAEMVKAIREAGRIPVQRDTFYEPIRVIDGAIPTQVDGIPERTQLLENNLATA